MNAYFGTSRNVGVESGIRISRLRTQFAVIRFEAKHDGDRTNINIPGYDVNINFCHYEQMHYTTHTSCMEKHKSVTKHTGSTTHRWTSLRRGGSAGLDVW